MYLRPNLAQTLDRAVDVLVLGLDPATGRDLDEPRLGVSELGVVEQAGRMEPACVHRGRFAVVRQQLGVVCAEKGGHCRIERAPDAPGPERHASAFARARAAASSTSKEAILMYPSAAACGKVSPVP